MKGEKKRGSSFYLLVLAVIFFALAIGVTFFSASPCEDFQCFQKGMKECKKVSYINEGDEATWKYEVLGVSGDQCEVKVKLLQPKAGELGIEKLIGTEMTCAFPRGVSAYPEKDLERCHGRLKEELQDLVIKRLHRYLIENLGEVENALNVFIEESGSSS